MTNGTFTQQTQRQSLTIAQNQTLDTVYHPLTKPAPEKEMNDEKIKRMRAYQSFLRIQENEKNSGGLLEDFGSSVINILKLPTQIKMPQFIQSGTNLITGALDKNKQNQQNDERGTTLQQNAKNNLDDKETKRLLNKPGQDDSSIQLIQTQRGGDRDESKMSRGSEMQIIVDTSRIVQISEEKKDTNNINDRSSLNNQQNQVNTLMQNQRFDSVTTQSMRPSSTNYVLGQQTFTTQKQDNLLNEDNSNEMKYGVYLQEEFNYADYLGDLNLRQIQMQKDKSRRWFPIQPDSNFRITWDMIGFVLIIYQAILIPYRFCFKSKAKGRLLYFETAIDIFFIGDFFLNFVTGYYKKGHVIMKRGVIIKHYLRTWFLIDILATFPYSWIVKDKKIDYWPEEHEEVDTIDSTENNLIQWNQSFPHIYGQLPPVFTPTSATDFGLPALLRLLKLIRLIRLIKALQIFKLRKFIYRYEWFFFNDTVTIMSDLFKVLISVLFIIHWMSCIFFLIADIEDDSQGQATWLLLLTKDDLKSPINVYVASISFSFTTITTVGYGDVYAVTDVEKLFAMVAMLISCGIFAYIVGFLGALFDRSNQIVGEFQDQIIRINQYLVKMKTPKVFRKKVKRYLIYLLSNKTDNKMEESEVFEMLSDNLKQELVIHLNGKMLHQTPPFYHFKLEFLLDITFILKRETFTIDEKLFEEDDQGDHLHYVTKGQVNLTQKKTATYIKEISYDTFLGELSFFSGQPRKASAKSKNFTETLTLYMGDFLEAISQHADEQQKFELIRKTVLENEDYSILGTKCYICDKLGHISVDCEQFNVIKGNLREVAMERMRQHALKKKQMQESKGNKFEKVKKKRNEDSIVSFEAELNNSGSLEDNSIIEMFSYLERRYKNDETPKAKIPDLKSQASSTSQDQQATPNQQDNNSGSKPPKITHLAQVIPLTESRNIQHLKNQNFLKPQNIDLIEENSIEESLISRESLMLRQSIESQLALVNKLSEIQTIGQSVQLSQQLAGRQSERPLGSRLLRSQEGNMLFKSTTDVDLFNVEDPQSNLDKIRLSRGHMGQSMIAKKKLNRQSQFEQIDEEEQDDELIMHMSLTEQKQNQRSGRNIFTENQAQLIPLQTIGSTGGGLLAQMLQNQQNLEELKQDPVHKTKKTSSNVAGLISKKTDKFKKQKVGVIPEDFKFEDDDVNIRFTEQLLDTNEFNEQNQNIADDTESLDKSDKKKAQGMQKIFKNKLN